MKIIALTLALAAVAQTGAGPTAAQFNAALAAACPTPRAQTRNISCTRAEEGSIQFSCRYEMQGANGRWAQHTATLQIAEGQWVWIDGPTRCSDDEQPELN